MHYQASFVLSAAVFASIASADSINNQKQFQQLYEGANTSFNNDGFKAKDDEKYCYALALSGGGSFGTYETGVVWGLLHYGNPDDYRWDVFTGVSAGSLNAGMFAVWPKG